MLCIFLTRNQYYHDVIITINQIGGYGGKENKRKK